MPVPSRWAIPVNYRVVRWSTWNQTLWMDPLRPRRNCSRGTEDIRRRT